MRVFVDRASRAHAPSLPRSVRQNRAGNLSRADRVYLGERLRAMYDALQDEPLPQRLQDLIGRLAQDPSESIDDKG